VWTGSRPTLRAQGPCILDLDPCLCSIPLVWICYTSVNCTWSVTSAALMRGQQSLPQRHQRHALSSIMKPVLLAEQCLSTNWMGLAIVSAPTLEQSKQQVYLEQQQLHSDELAMLHCRPQWRPSRTTPRMLTPHHSLSWLQPPNPQQKPWARRKPPLDYVPQVCVVSLFADSHLLPVSRRLCCVQLTGHRTAGGHTCSKHISTIAG
jgi:hypothetical protein